MSSPLWPRGLSLALLLGPMLMAGTSRAQDQATQLEDVVVQGRALTEAVRQFVDEVVAPPRGHGPARWDRRVCVGVVNLRQEAAQVIIDRVSAAAEVVDLQPDGPGCRPNILVIATDDSDGLANALVEASPLAFRPRYSGAARSERALEAFRVSDRPVRWWSVSLPVIRDTGEPAVRLPGRSAPLIPGSGRLRTEVTNRLVRSFVIVDVSRIEGVTFQQLGDYVAMIALSQIDLEADTASFDTVLNLFNAPGRADTLTDWDRSYLTSLYGSYLNQRNPDAQAGEVGSSMTRDRRTAQQAGGAIEPER